MPFKILTSEALVLVELVRKCQVKQKTLRQDCQRRAFENHLRYGVPDCRCSIMKTATMKAVLMYGSEAANERIHNHVAQCDGYNS